MISSTRSFIIVTVTVVLSVFLIVSIFTNPVLYRFRDAKNTLSASLSIHVYVETVPLLLYP
jgi:heme/copper-type cytochrome/quinol oxidase subunit 2